MPSLEYFVVAESMATDLERNTLSVFHVLEELSGPLPLRIPLAVAVSSWNLVPEDIGRDFQVALRIHLPEGRRVPESGDLTVNFTGRSSRHRVSQSVRGLMFAQYGDATFEVLLNGEHQASHRVTICAPEDER